MGGKRGATRGRPFRPFQKVPYLVSEIYILFPFCRFSTGRPPGNRGGIWCRLGLANFRGMLRRLEKLASNKSSDTGSLSQAAEVPDQGKSDLMGCFGKVYVHMGGMKVYLLQLEKESHACFRAYLRVKACINILHAPDCLAYLHFYARYICISRAFDSCNGCVGLCVYACQNQGREGGKGGGKSQIKMINDCFLSPMVI